MTPVFDLLRLSLISMDVVAAQRSGRVGIAQRQRNRLVVAIIIDGALLALTVLALIVGAKWLATLLLIACVPGAIVGLAAGIWRSGIYPWSRRP